MLFRSTTGRLVNGSLCGGIDVVIEYLDLEPKFYPVVRDFVKEVFESGPCLVKGFALMLLEHQDVIPKFSSSPRWEKLGKEKGG